MRDVHLWKHLPNLVLLLVFAAGTTLWLLFVTEQRSHVEAGFQNQLERLADELLRTRLEGDLGPELPEGIEAFGIYGPRGELVASWGQPLSETIDPPPPGPRNGPPLPSTLTRDGRWLELVRSLQPLRPRMMWFGDPGPPPARRSQGFLFLRVPAEPLERQLWGWTLGAVGGVAAWAGFVAFVGVLWARTRRYQKALDHHRELLQFAEASRTLGHELQNPLAAILLQTALLKRGTEQVPPEVLVIEEEARRMSGLVARVRDFLKDPQGQPEVIDLSALVETLGGRFAVRVEVERVGPTPFSVRFDAYRLRSVVENLLKNAVESGPDPRPRARLSRPRTGWVRLEVIDSGSGFTPEGLKKARSPFYTTKASGSGIGLAIVDGFVTAVGGKLRFENRSEGGARVTLDLPEGAP